MISTPRTDEVEDSFDGEQECWSTQHVANMAFAHSRTLERELTTLAEMLGDPTDAMIAAAVESGCCNSPVCRKDIFRAMSAEALKSIGCPIPNAGASEVRPTAAPPMADENAASAGDGRQQDRQAGSIPARPAIQPADHDQVERDIDDDPYFVEVDVNGCAHCKGGRMWTVIGPDTVACGISWEDVENAEDYAEACNDAYAHGRINGLHDAQQACMDQTTDPPAPSDYNGACHDCAQAIAALSSDEKKPAHGGPVDGASGD